MRARVFNGRLVEGGIEAAEVTPTLFALMSLRTPSAFKATAAFRSFASCTTCLAQHDPEM